MQTAWEAHAHEWLQWARTPGHDVAYEAFIDSFFDAIVPARGRRTLELGCGEGRVARELAARGHAVTGCDLSTTLIRAAHESGNEAYVQCDAGRLPFADESFDVAVAYNSLMDVDDLPGTINEVGRVLLPQSPFCICVTHPVADAGTFTEHSARAAFVITGAYLSRRPFELAVERGGLTMTFSGWAHSLENYARALEDAGFLIERVREPAFPDAFVAKDGSAARWQRIPNFLWLRVLKQRSAESIQYP